MPEAPRPSRPYNSPIRRQQTERTRERILDAGSEIVHEFPIWNWDAVTHRAVAERSGVSLRTVYRYFATERDLRDAVLDRITAQSGIDFGSLRLEDLKDAASRIIDSIAAFPPAPTSPLEPTIEAARAKQRQGYVAAVARATPDWAPRDQRLAAAMFYVLSTNAVYTTLVNEWSLAPTEAATGIAWVIGRIEDAIRGDVPPGTSNAE